MLFAILKKVLIIFTTKGECKPCIIERSTRRYYEKKYQKSNQQNISHEKNRDVLLAKSKANQQNRKPHTQKIEEFNIKVKELTQAMERLFLKTD